LEVLSPKDSMTLAQLDLGEAETITLATEMHADVLLMDEQAVQGRVASISAKTVEAVLNRTSSVSFGPLQQNYRAASGFTITPYAAAFFRMKRRTMAFAIRTRANVQTMVAPVGRSIGSICDEPPVALADLNSGVWPETAASASAHVKR
jgi:hypothetical protein